MNVRRCLNRLMKRLGNRTSPVLRADCLEEMVLAQEKLEDAPELPWFLQSEKVTTETDPLEPRLAIPPDFIREVEDFNLEISTDGGEVWSDLAVKTYDQAQVEIDRNADPGVPSMYYRRGDYLILRPTPADIYLVRFPTYYARQAEPIDDDASENAWFKNVPGLLIAMAGLNISTSQLKDPDLITYFSNQATEEMNSLVRRMTAHEEENRDRQMG